MCLLSTVKGRFPGWESDGDQERVMACAEVSGDCVRRSRAGDADRDVEWRAEGGRLVGCTARGCVHGWRRRDIEVWWYTAGTVTPNYRTADTRDRNELYHDLPLRSVLGEEFSATPQIVPVRAVLDSVNALMRGDCYIGRGCRQRGLTRSRFANPFKIAEFGREQAIAQCIERYLEDDAQRKSALWTLSDLRLICHCAEHQACHADSLIAAYRDAFTKAHDLNDHAVNPPSSQQLNFLA